MNHIIISVAAAVLTASVCMAEPPVHFVRTDVPNKAFYKDLFMDTGIRMMEYRTLPVVDYLDLQYEYFFAPENTPENQILQDAAYCGNPEDLNGVFLYPDGEPRFRIVYVNGGYAGSHSLSYKAEGRNNLRRFVLNGGSLVGSCAGSFLSSFGTTSSYYAQHGYLGLWPGLVDNTGVTLHPAYDIPETSPIRKYYDFGGNYKLEEILHMNGPFFSKWAEVPYTEVLAVNNCPDYKFDGQPSIIAYKPDTFRGRLVCSGGHPEQVAEGEGLGLMAALVNYAFDGLGITRAKGELFNGETRTMDRSTADNDPEYTRIGDRQCHHFVFSLPKGARNIRIRLEALEPFNLSLRLANGTFAFKEDAEYSVENGDAVKTLSFDRLPDGLWYVGVQCEETVDCTFGEHGFQYSGRTEVLNGVPYKISVAWDGGRRAWPVSFPQRKIHNGALLASGSDFNEVVKQLVDQEAKASSIDSLITKITFRSSDSCADGQRVDNIISSLPVYASRQGSEITITTAAPKFIVPVDASFMFSDLKALKEIKGVENLDFSETVYKNDMFQGCPDFDSDKFFSNNSL